MHPLLCLSLIAGAVAGATNGPTPTASIPGPTITLDYSTIAPAAINVTGGWLRYQNIRYAAIPTGTLRWREPQWPVHDPELNTGTLAAQNVTCQTTEDCLFVDVWVPATPRKKNLPVMVWAYGGGFNQGSKTQNTPEGLFELSNDFIYVGHNYRVGITGLATGPSFQHQGGTSNVALWDTEHAFRWVKKYVSAFGGDPDQVVATGHSAGASMMMFQMTRFGGRAEQLFDRAFLQTSGYFPQAGHWSTEQFWQKVLAAAGCVGGGLDCMRNVPFDILRKVATTAVGNMSYFQLQPKRDGSFVPDAYESAFYKGNFNFTGPVVITHGEHEANSVPTRGIDTEEDIRKYLKGYFPAMPDAAVDTLLALYPSTSYPSPGLRMADIDQSFEYNARNLAVTHAMRNKTWNGLFAVPPARHMTDQSYYWYSTSGAGIDPGIGAGVGVKINAAVARMMQKHLLSFVITGDVNKMWGNETVYWPRYDENGGNGGKGNMLVMNDTRFSVTEDDLANENSLFWNKGYWN